MTFKDNTPTFNVNRKVVNFKDFSKDIESEKEELDKIKRQNKPNSERQQLIGNTRIKYNKVSRKMDWNISPDMIKGKIDAIEELEESKINESTIDDNVYDDLKQSSKYRKLVDNFRSAIRNFESEVSNLYDEGENDQYMAFQAILQDALDEAQ
jgi:hypothetical protein